MPTTYVSREHSILIVRQIYKEKKYSYCMDKKFLDRAIILFGLGVLLVLTYVTLKALLLPIFLAFILGYAFRPAYNAVLRRVKLKSISALIIILALIGLIITPLTFLAPSLIKQTFDLYLKVQDLNIATSINSLLPIGLAPDVARAMGLQVNNILAKLFSSLMNGFSAFLTDLPSKIFNLIIFLFIFYFILVDFEKMGKYFSDFLPLSNEVKKKFSMEFRNVTDGILYGQVLIGILQGILVGLLLFIFEVPGALLFTLIAVIAGILPMIGPTVVWIPVGIYLLVMGSPAKAVILAIWGMIISGVTEGIVKPYIISRRSSLPIAWGFIGTIGGLFAFGLVGFLLGPLIISYVIIVSQFYKEGKFNELFKA